MKIICEEDHDSFIYTILESGLYHREDGPAVVWKNGEYEWIRFDFYENSDGPVFDSPSGFKRWHKGHDFITEQEFIRATKGTK